MLKPLRLYTHTHTHTHTGNLENNKGICKYRNILEKQSGITLIALVIIVIVLLILAGITISVITGENGIINQAKEAKLASEKEEAKEKLKLEIGGSFDRSGVFQMDMLKHKKKETEEKKKK